MSIKKYSLAYGMRNRRSYNLLTMLISYRKYHTLFKIGILQFLFILLNFNVFAQVFKPVQNNNKFPLQPGFNLPSGQNVHFARLNASGNFSGARIKRTENGSTCNTSTFYMHLPAGVGKKINLKELQTLPDGNFILAGNITLANTQQEGLIYIMTNAGDIVSQTQLRINDKPSTIYSVKVFLDGTIFIAGVVHDVTDQLFVCRLNTNLTTQWLKIFNMPLTPAKVTLNLVQNAYLTVAVQLSNSIIYSLLNPDGSVVWQNQVSPAGLNDLVGFGEDGQVCLVVNCTRGGKKIVEMLDADRSNGAVTASYVAGDGTDERQYAETKAFNGRFLTTGIIKKSATTYELVRNILYSPQQTETQHTYNLPLPADFNTTAAMDNAGDVMGFCYPAQGRLAFIRQFAYYQTSPEYTRQYNVPVGSSIAAVARSFNDGGYLFGLNTIGADELILIKTDSIGILSGCDYKNITNDFEETINVSNTASATRGAAINGTSLSGTISYSNASLAPQFDCKQIYCPAAPQEDTCLSTFYKRFRSGTYVNGFGAYYLMHNDNHLIFTSKLQRVLGNSNQQSFGIQLFGPSGNFIKGVTIFYDSVSTVVDSKQIDDQHVMLIGYTVKDNLPCFTFMLIDDNLQVVWTKSIKTFAGFNYNNANIFGSPVTDKDGNFYFIGCTLAYSGLSRLLAYKIDKNGNEDWLKIYDMHGGQPFITSAATTNTSLIIVAEGGSPGCMSARLDLATGNMLNAYTFHNDFDGADYVRFLQFDNDRLMYAGSDHSSNLMTGIFDTTGKPIVLKVFNQSASIPRTATEKSGMMYILFNFFGANGYTSALLKEDTSLTVKFINQFDNPPVSSFMAGMAVSNNGGIYAAGNISYGGIEGSYLDGFLEKFDQNGTIGTCGYQHVDPVFTNIDPAAAPLTFSPIINSFSPTNVSMTLVPDTVAQNVSAILCSSVPLCTSIKVSGQVSVCNPGQTYLYRAIKNAGCNLEPLWVYDTAFVSVKTNMDSVISLSFKKTGSTYIKAVLNAGCKTYMDSLLVHIQNTKSGFTLGIDTVLCPGDTIRLNAGAEFSSYTWQDGSSDSVFTVTKQGQYYIQVSNLCGDNYKDTIVISGASVPVLSIGNDSSVCIGDIVQLNASPGFASYFWKPALLISGQSPQVSIKPLQDETITVTAITKEGCTAYDTLHINSISAHPFFLGNDTSFCTSQSITLSGSTSYVAYMWSTGSTSPAITVSLQGMYWLHAKASNGCIARDTINVLQVFTLPAPSLGNDFNLCQAQQQKLTPGVFNTYLWQDGSSQSYYTAAAPGLYYVTVTDINNCSARDSVTVLSILPSPSGFLKQVDSICQYETVSLQAIGNYASYSWSTGSSQPGITVGSPGSYTLTVQDTNGCKGTDTINVIQKNCFFGVYIPNAFTPNSDGKNDVFKAKVFGKVIYFQLQVYNRFGALVFSTTNPQQGWDGKVKGNEADTGVFVWQLSYQLSGGKPVYEKGTVTLLH